MIDQAPQPIKSNSGNEDPSRSFFDKIRNRKVAMGLIGLAIAAGGAGKAKAAQHEASANTVAALSSAAHPNQTSKNKNPLVKMQAETAKVLDEMNKNPQILNCTIFLPQEKYGSQYSYPYFKLFPFENAPVFSDSLSFLNNKFNQTVPEIVNPRYMVDSHGTEWIYMNDARDLIPNDPDNYREFSPYPFPANYVSMRGSARWQRVKDLPKGTEVYQVPGSVGGGKHVIKGRLHYRGGVGSDDSNNFAIGGQYLEVNGLADTDIAMLNHVSPDIHAQFKASFKRFPSLEKFIHS